MHTPIAAFMVKVESWFGSVLVLVTELVVIDCVEVMVRGIVALPIDGGGIGRDIVCHVATENFTVSNKIRAELCCALSGVSRLDQEGEEGEPEASLCI